MKYYVIFYYTVPGYEYNEDKVGVEEFSSFEDAELFIKKGAYGVLEEWKIIYGEEVEII